MKPYINEDGTEKNNFAARFRKAFNAAFDAMIERYKKGVLFFIKRKWMVWTLLAASVAVSYTHLDVYKRQAQGAVEYAKELGCAKPEIVLHLDHGDTFETCKSCIDSGFSSVMPLIYAMNMWRKMHA